jgi:hypothetical protein
MRVSFRDPAWRVGSECRNRLVVGGPHRRARYGADHHERGLGSVPRREVRGLSLISKLCGHPECLGFQVAFRLLTPTAHYLEAVEGAFGMDVDYAMLHKIYGAPSDEEELRYSPATFLGCDMKTVSGDPDPKHISTSFVERQNLTMRMGMRRFTRLTNGFSKRVDNHRHAVALHFPSLQHWKNPQIPESYAMEAGLADHVWSLEEIVGLLRENRQLQQY